MKTISILLLSVAGCMAAEENLTTANEKTQRVAFSQSCFWTGEMKLGQINGVVRTEAGFLQGHEVTVVDFAPSRVSLRVLARQAQAAGVADRIHFPADALRPEASGLGMKEGASLDRSYRAAPASDQKKQLEGTALARLALTPEQATKLNAFFRQDPARALEWLTPDQRAQLKDNR